MKNIKVFAFADEASPDIDLQIRALRRNNLDGIEIRKVYNENVSEITAETAKEVRKKLDDAGLITWSVGSPIGKVDIETCDFKAHTDKLKHTLEIASILGTQRIRMFSFYIPHGKNHEDYKNEVIERLSAFAEIAESYKIHLCHENEKEIYGDIAVRCLDILNAVPKIRGIFDPANFVQCGQETVEAWNMLKPYIDYMHIKDALSDGRVVPAGKGEGNINVILSDYIKSGGTALTVEPHLKVFKGLASLEREGEKSNVGTDFYPDSDTAFDTACDALKNILKTI